MAAVAFLLVGCSSHDEPTAKATTTVAAKPPASASHTVLDYIDGDSDLSSLAALVHGSAFEKTLDAAGPLTFFAPTNEALATLAPASRAQLSDPAVLAKLLNPHIVEKKLTAAQLIPLAGQTIDSLGGPVTVAIDGRTLRIGGAAVTRTDILASNGVVHLVGGIVAAAP